jgi:hypothetical protein
VKIWLVLGILAAVALLVAFWAAIYAPSPPRGFPGRLFPGDIELYYTVKTVVSTINVAILIILLSTYIGIYRKTKSEFTIGLTIFSMVLLLNALASNPLIIQGFGFQPFGLGPFAMLPDLFTCVALIILLYLSVKY